MAPSPPLPEARLPTLLDQDEEEDDDMEYEPAFETTDESVDESLEDGEDDDEEDGEEEDTEYLDSEDAEEEIEAEAFIEELLAEAGGELDSGAEIEVEEEEEDDDDDDEDEEEGVEGGTETPTAAAAEAGTAAGARAAPTTMTITRHELLQLLARSGAVRFLRSAPAPADDDDDDEPRRRGNRRRRAANQHDAPKIPSEAGRELMESGTFGTNEREDGQYKRKKKLASRLMRRELGLDSPGKQRTHNRLASQDLIPSSNADTIIHYDSRCYSGQFSDDGNFFFSCSQDFKVRMYDTSNPYNWRHYKTCIYPGGQWTITDATLSPDNKFLAYSSIRSIVCLAHTDPEQDNEPYLLNLADVGRRGGAYSHSHFGIWSLRFSGDGTEIVAGTGDNSVYVYDLETRQTILRIRGHDDDVNAVCYGDKSSPHILYSGSDDTTIKVWDRRSLGDQREAGVFLGHTEGLTYVDSKGDGRYVLSNGKDQSMKLWDLRKMISTEKAERIDFSQYTTGFDYRFEDYQPEYTPHPHDCSIVTFRGHRVLKTLIRCHFSPPGSTDSRYVYTGSEDGSVYIYNMDATLAGKVDVEKATYNSRPRGGEDPGYFYFDDGRGGRSWKTCVRDASWHPNAPVIAATAWNGYGMMYGTATIHTWNDGLDTDEAEPAMGQRVNAELRPDRKLHDFEAPGGQTGQGEGARRNQAPRARWSLRRRMLGGDDDE